jgi:hypothetical protein
MPENFANFRPKIGWPKYPRQMLALNVVPWAETLIASIPTNDIAAHISRPSEALNALVAVRQIDHPCAHQSFKRLIVHKQDASGGRDGRPTCDFV